MKIGEPRLEPAAAMLLILDRGMGGSVCPHPSGRGFSYRAAAQGVLPPPPMTPVFMGAISVPLHGEFAKRQFVAAVIWRRCGPRAQQAALPHQGEVFRTAPLRGEFSSLSLAPVFLGAISLLPCGEFNGRPPSSQP